MKSKYINSIAAAALMLLAGGCGVNYIDTPEDPDNPWTPDIPSEVNGSMMDYPVWGTVTDADGNPLQGVEVKSGETSVISDAAGFFSLDRIDEVSNRAIVKFSKDGYFPVVRSCELNRFTKYGWEVALASKLSDEMTSARFSSSSGTTLNASGMSVTLPADAYVDATSGIEYYGTVNAEMYYLSPESDRFIALMPGGDLAAYAEGGARSVLTSYGMVGVDLTDEAGNRLQLADYTKATVSFPVVQSMAAGMSDAIPLWSFDEKTGTWQEEGVATNDGNGHFVGDVAHFSWWNLDTSAPLATMHGYVTNVWGERLPDIEIVVNKQLRVKTDSDGYYRMTVCAGYEFEVKVPSASYGGYSPEYRETTGPVVANTEYRYDITLPGLYCVYGRITDEYGRGLNGAYRIKYSDVDSGWQTTDDKGNYRYYIKSGYAGPASISAVSGKGNVDNLQFTVPGKENVEVNLTVNSGTGVPDGPDIVADCGDEGVYYLSVDSPDAETLGGVIIEDSYMTVLTDMSDGIDPADIFMLQIPNYSPEVEEYTAFTLMASDGNKLVICQDGGSLTVTQNNDIYYYNISASGIYATLINGDYTNPKEANVTVNNVGISHLMTLKREVSYTPASPLPAFTPRLSVPAPVALIITKSQKLGTGGFLFYNGGIGDFNNLAAQAAAASYTQLYNDNGDDYRDEVYMKGNSAIQLEADPSAPVIDSYSWTGIPIFGIAGGEEYEDAYESQIIVRMFNGGTLPLRDMFMDEPDDDYMRAMRRCVSKARRLRNLNLRK